MISEWQELERSFKIPGYK